MFSPKTFLVLVILFLCTPTAAPAPRPASIHRQHPSACIQWAFLGHTSCTLMGLRSLQNAAAIFPFVESESWKLPTHLNDSPAERGCCSQRVPSSWASWPREPRLPANLLKVVCHRENGRWIGSEREQKRPMSNLYPKICAGSPVCCSSEWILHKPVNRDLVKHSVLCQCKYCVRLLFF